MKRINGIDSNMIANNLTPILQTHPGEVIKDEVEARGMSQKTLADNMGMSYKALNDILNERRPVSVDSAMMFEAALGIPAQTLLGLQIEYDIAKNKKDKSFLQRIASIKRVAAVL